MIKAVLFDFDGTLSNRQINAYSIFKDLLKPYFKDFNDYEFEAVLQDLLTDDCNGTINVRFRLLPFVDKYKEYFGEEEIEKFSKEYYDHMGEYTVLQPKTIDVLKALKGKYKLGIVTNGISKCQHDKIEHVGISEYFDEIIVSGDTENNIRKPNKEIFELMCNKLNVKAEECVFVGDVFSTDILGALRAGMIPIWIVSDVDRPASYYKGIRIQNISELVGVLEKIDK